MKRYNGGRPSIYQGALNAPYSTAQRPKFASCDRLPPAKAHRRTWAELFEDVFHTVTSVCIVIFIIELIIQVIIYGYLETPGARSDIRGQTYTHYETLRIGHEADQDEITRAWREREKEYHPDLVPVGNTEGSREDYYWIQLAYVELSDPLARCYHDQYHGFIPRKFGTDDPCTKILTERGRDARKGERNGRTDTWEGEESEEHEGVWEQLGKLFKQIAAWPFITLNFLLRLIELLVQYISGLAE